MRYITLFAFVAKDSYFCDYFVGFVVNLVTGMVNHKRSADVAVNLNSYCVNYFLVGIDIAAKV